MSVKNVLLIDDLRSFRSAPENSVVTVARTSAEAVAVLENMQDVVWDEIWFDHDLGLLDDGTPDTTMVVVDYLGERAFNGNPVEAHQVIIHTSNPPGRDNIRRAMTARGYRSVVVAPEQFFIVETD